LALGSSALLLCFHLYNSKKFIELLIIFALLVVCFIACRFSFHFQFLVGFLFKEQLQRADAPSLGAEPLQKELGAQVGNEVFGSFHA